MSAIRVLDNDTIDKIAAGEVVERPLSIVKELVENSMDAGADRISVEIRGGGTDFIRVTDNGRGIAREDIPMAFLRHATSKIRDIEDLNSLNSMGFRGEALSSIASVCKVTLMTKRSEDLMGYKLQINGGKAEEIEEIGVPDGTTVIAAHLFYNTPVRRKFLKSATGEGNAVSELMERLALSRPDISYKYVVNGNTRFMTSGNGDLKETIHRIYGRDAAKWIVPVSYEKDGIRIDGYLGTPAMNRPNRNFETYFLNHRYIRSEVVAKGIEEGYKGYMMQHKFPFCVLHITMDQSEIDINVHPSKMDVRFHDREAFYDHLSEAVAGTLHNREMIPEDESREEEEKIKTPVFEPFEKRQEEILPGDENSDAADDDPDGQDENPDTRDDIFEVRFEDDKEEGEIVLETPKPAAVEKVQESYFIPEDPYKNAKQIEMLPKERVISKKAREQYRLIGQVFNTYWMFSYQDKLYFLDQHAAHEKVNYERLVKRYRDNEVYSQLLSPGLVVSLSPKERTVLEEYSEVFEKLGFETEDFGGNEIILKAVPQETFKKTGDELFLNILNDLAEKGSGRIPDVIDRVIATMACKASVKGGDEVSFKEMETVLDELLELENPYHCPHGRPTMFSMSRMELERKFKRIVN
ncbi:MAG: DNA mismatch repair endonuclease MutL [Lachnospiraceae bacterium]|nr:DNA mismatch repair endonuclease MutL [Lachnospiraceae bacterium]